MWRATIDARKTPLEATWGHEVAEAALRSGFDRGSTSDFPRKLDATARGKATGPSAHISQCRDLAQALPLASYQDIYARVKEETTGMGLSFP